MESRYRSVVVFLLILVVRMVVPGLILGQTPETPVLTVCDVMKDLPAHKQKTVIVVGRSKGTMEGSWLDQDCATKLITFGYEWSTSISLSYVVQQTAPAPVLPKGFHWDKTLLNQKLDEVRRTTVLEVLPQYHYSDEWIAVYGRLETYFPVDSALKPYGFVKPNVRIAPGMGHPAGFGHLNGSPAQLVWPQKGIYRFPRKK
ncbi:MAG TPA: hypothetical protein VLY04_18505 [Bryobacteraceae bacterium]|nr:hypothetical protein [Bryobacteraceae bacterium]